MCPVAGAGARRECRRRPEWLHSGPFPVSLICTSPARPWGLAAPAWPFGRGTRNGRGMGGSRWGGAYGGMGLPQWVHEFADAVSAVEGSRTGSVDLTSCLECQAGAEEMGHPRRSPASLPHLTSDLLINGPGGFKYTGLGSKRREIPAALPKSGTPLPRLF